MAALVIFMRRNANRALRRERVFRNRSDPLEMYNDFDLIERYRFDRNSILYIHEVIGNLICSSTNTNHALSSMLQIIITLHFMASGSFLRVIGDVHGVHKSTVSRVIVKVSEALCNCQQLRIKFPFNAQSVLSVINNFAAKGFPNTIGVIDGTHVRIMSPTGENRERNYVNRKLQHSINCQIICDSKYNILNLVVKWPGSTHDAFMWEQSMICQRFRDGILTKG